MSMKRITIAIMIITLASKVIGLLREITLSYLYGATSISDAYLISLTIPIVLFSFIGVALTTSYIPIYSRIENENGKEKADYFTSNLTNFVVLLCVIITIVVLIFPASIIKLFASGFEGETLRLAISFTRTTIFGICFTSIVYILGAYVQLKNNYLVPAIIGLVMNIIALTSIIISSHTNLIVLPVGILFSIISQVVILIPFANKKGYKHAFVFNTSDKNLRKMIKLSIPVILGTSVNEINQMIDKTLASKLAIGGISALNYSSKVGQLIQGVFVMSISTVMYPQTSKMASQNNISDMKRLILRNVNVLNLLIIPSTVGIFMFSQPIVKLLFGRGAFDNEAISMTSNALLYYSIGMIAIAHRELLSKTFYSLQDTKTPMVNATIGMFTNIILNILLSKHMGVSGLALASSLAAILTTTLMVIKLEKKIGILHIKSICTSFLKILISSLIMAVFARFAFIYMNRVLYSENLSLLLSIGIGTITYGIIICILKIDGVDSIVNLIKRIFSKK
jgi:putative peptidoglycan lipid II flippase